MSLFLHPLSLDRVDQGRFIIELGSALRVPKREQRRRLWVLLCGPHVLRQWGDILVVFFNTLWAIAYSARTKFSIEEWRWHRRKKVKERNISFLQQDIPCTEMRRADDELIDVTFLSFFLSSLKGLVNVVITFRISDFQTFRDHRGAQSIESRSVTSLEGTLCPPKLEKN